MNDLDEIGRKLDLLIALTRLGVRDALTRERRALEGDEVFSAILELTGTWINAGELKKAVRERTKQSEPTVKRRLAELVSRGVLLRRGAGSNVSYCSSGLVVF